MHELSIAQNIVDIIQQSVPQEELKDVVKVKLKIGDLSGVLSDSLDFSFTAIVAGTPLAHARLWIEHVPFMIQCNSCRKTERNELGFALCPSCGSDDTQIVSGTELQIVEIELTEQLAEAPLRNPNIYARGISPPEADAPMAQAFG